MTTYTKKKQVDGIYRRERVIPVMPEKNLNRGVLFHVLKVCGIGMATVALFVGISFTGSTSAYFNDTEYSTGNKFSAGILGFDLVSAGYGHEYATSTEENVGSVFFEVVIEPRSDILPLSYVTSGHVDSNSSGCDELYLEANFGSYNYVGLLKDFVSTPQTVGGEWSFRVSLPTPNTLASMEECEGEIVFDAGLANVSSDLTHTFTDKKIYSFELYNWKSVGGSIHESDTVTSEPEVSETEVIVETPTEVTLEKPTVKEDEVVVEVDIPVEIPHEEQEKHEEHEEIPTPTEETHIEEN